MKINMCQKSIKTLFLLLCLAVAGSACANSPAGSAPSANVEDEYRPQADTLQIPSAKMGRDITTVVIVPENYYDPELQEEQFPVVYLLHGATGCYRDWPTKADLDSYANDYGIIIVCPDGQDSWYWDSPIDPKMQFETFVSQELVAYVDNHYRTYAEPGMRAITGLSMGGHGALWNGLRHPDVFGACGSMSGGVDVTQFPDRWHIQARLGTYAENKQRWADHAVINLIPGLKTTQAIIIDDGYDDFFYKVNCELHDAMLKQGVKHDFIIRPGNHSWNYWVNALDYQILFFVKAFSSGD